MRQSGAPLPAARPLAPDARPLAERIRDRAGAGAGGGGCAGAPMSQSQVLGFLHQRIPGDPFADNPRREAALAARVTKLVTGHTFRHSFATPLLEDVYDV